MRHGDLEDRPRGNSTRERRAIRTDAQVDVVADEPQGVVHDHRPREKTRFEQDLEAVADPDDRSPAFGEPAHRPHHGRELRHRPRAQVVAVGEAPGDDDGVEPVEGGSLVPDELRVHPDHVLQGVVGIVVAVGAGEHEDGGLHRGWWSFS
jgi:hypothetical protein